MSQFTKDAAARAARKIVKRYGLPNPDKSEPFVVAIIQEEGVYLNEALVGSLRGLIRRCEIIELSDELPELAQARKVLAAWDYDARTARKKKEGQ